MDLIHLLHRQRLQDQRLLLAIPVHPMKVREGIVTSVVRKRYLVPM